MSFARLRWGRLRPRPAGSNLFRRGRLRNLLGRRLGYSRWRDRRGVRPCRCRFLPRRIAGGSSSIGLQPVQGSSSIGLQPFQRALHPAQDEDDLLGLVLLPAAQEQPRQRPRVDAVPVREAEDEAFGRLESRRRLLVAPLLVPQPL
jgi:hypothetical protein